MIADEELDQFIDVEDEELEEIERLEKARNAQNEEFDGFIKTLEHAKTVLEKDGPLSGLCAHCKGSGKVIVEKAGGYEGVQAKKDGDIIMMIPCNHGKSNRQDFGF